MHILFICHGNICRSAYAEYIMRDDLRRLKVQDVTVSSRSLLPAPGAPMANQYVKRLASLGIDASQHRSRTVDGAAVRSAGLILVFTRKQLDDVIDREFNAFGKTYLLDDFANLCQANEHDLERRTSPEDRLHAVINAEPFVRPMLPRPHDIEDPHGRTNDVYNDVAQRIDLRVQIIAAALTGNQQL